MHDLTAIWHALGHMCVGLTLLRGRASRAIDAKAAQRMQSAAESVGETLLWTVYGSRDKFVARPCMTSGWITPMPVHLEAPTLEGLRALLPAGLTRADRFEDDDPIVVETWQ